MFFASRPSRQTVERFLSSSQKLPLSYRPVGIANNGTLRDDLDEEVFVIGRGVADFERARGALGAWKQFELGWVELFPVSVPPVAGTDVAVLIRHFGFWSLNGCRVVYGVGNRDRGGRFGFAHGTLTNHAESGEELFEVVLDPASDEVLYRIRAISRPRALLARLGRPAVRELQARFRRDSGTAMTRATRADN